MASGDFLFGAFAFQGFSPGSSFAGSDVVAGASSPTEQKFVWDFDAASDEYVDFFLQMPANYGGGGVTLVVEVAASSATSGGFRIAAAFRQRAIGDDWDADVHSYAFNEVTVTVPGTVGNSVKGTITFTDGADMDSVGAGDWFVLRLWRNQAHAGDDAAGDMELERIYATET